MSLPYCVVPVLTVVGTPTLLFTIMRYGPDAVLRLLAGTVAVLTRDEQRSERCLELLRILRGRDRESSGDVTQSRPARSQAGGVRATRRASGPGLAPHVSRERSGHSEAPPPVFRPRRGLRSPRLRDQLKRDGYDAGS